MAHRRLEPSTNMTDVNASLAKIGIDGFEALKMQVFGQYYERAVIVQEVRVLFTHLIVKSFTSQFDSIK